MNLSPLIIHTATAYSGPPGMSSEHLQDRVLQLEKFERFVRERKEKVGREEEVFDAMLTPTVPVWQALFEENDLLSKEMRSIVLDMLNRSRQVTKEDFETGAPIASIGLWAGRADYIDSEMAWYRFRRATLHLCGITPATFCEQAKLLFPNLVFSSRFPDCLNSLEGGFDLFLPSVVKALERLNDQLLETIQGHEIKEGLKRFTALSEFETTMEGNADRNGDLTFTFSDPPKKLVCSPHMKLHTSMVPGDSRHYFNRIYFNSHQSGGDARIHVGHIGGHL